MGLISKSFGKGMESCLNSDMYSNTNDCGRGYLISHVLLNMLVTKDLDKKVFEYIYTWGETLASISWAIRNSYNCTIMTAPSQYIFGKYMVLNLALVVY